MNRNKILLYMKFILPSAMGAFLFMCPIKYKGDFTIPIAVMAKFMQSALEHGIKHILFFTILISCFLSLFWVFTKRFCPKLRILQNDLFKSLAEVKPVWLAARLLGAIFATIIYFDGSSVVNTMDTGGLVFYDLLPILFTIFFLAGVALPLLLNYGLLEFAGTLLIKVMRPVFGLPGRAAIDAITSWLGDGTIGVLLTSKQYEEGYYTEREACIIGTSFSLVSVTFSLVIIDTVGLAHMFLPFYFTVSIICIIVAIILPKLPPLRTKKNTFITGEVAEGERGQVLNTGFKAATENALKKVTHIDIVNSLWKDGVKNILEMWIAVLPVVMTIGTIALLIATHTPFFEILGTPFVPFLELLNIPEAGAAAQTLFAGFADMLLPAVMVADTVTSDLTRFVVAVVSVSQLIYLSEVGAMILASKIPIKLWELFVIFLERTIIVLPLAALFGHLFF